MVVKYYMGVYFIASVSSLFVTDIYIVDC